MSEIENQLIS